MMAGNCDICRKQIALHCHYLSCAACNRFYHIKCLPFVSKNDSIFVDRHKDNWICIRCVEEELPYNSLQDDDSFYDALSELWFDISDISIKELAKKNIHTF